MSDTPRTDEAQFGTGRVSVDFARRLERELNAATERIKLLEWAANDLVWLFCQKESSQLSAMQSEALKRWRDLRGRRNS